MSAELTEHDWNLHKPAIQALYLTENRSLEGSGGVMQHMSVEYGFYATKAQYVRHFGIWGFRKNKKRDVWEAIVPKVMKRKRNEKVSEVWTGIERVSLKKLRKELSRNGYDTVFPHRFQGPTPKTPEGIHVCTPPALQANTALLCDLPWFQFLAMIESKVKPYPDLAAVAINMASHSTGNTVLLEPQSLQTIGPIPAVLDQIISTLPTWATTVTPATQSNIIRHIHNHLRAIMPEDSNTDPNTGNQEIRGLFKVNGNVQYLSLAVYLVTNNMLDSEKVAIMAKLFQDKTSMQLLRSLLSTRNSTVEAFIENLFLGALEARCPRVLQECINAGVDPNSRLRERTALQYASCEGNIELVQILLDAGADVNALPADTYGRTALQAAAINDNIELVQILLNAGADVNALPADNNGRTALQGAAEDGDIKLVQMLLDVGADVNALPADECGRTALQAAVQNGNIELVQILLDAGADVNALPADNNGRTALQGAAEDGDIELVQMLLDVGADVNALPADTNGRTALQGAAQNGNIKLVRVLLDAGVDVNASAANTAGVTALQAAAIHGYIRLVTILLDAGANVNGIRASKDGRTALEGAAEHGRIDTVQLLLNAGADLSGDGNMQYRNAVQLASKNGHYSVKKLIEAHYQSDVAGH